MAPITALLPRRINFVFGAIGAAAIAVDIPEWRAPRYAAAIDTGAASGALGARASVDQSSLIQGALTEVRSELRVDQTKRAELRVDQTKDEAPVASGAASSAEMVVAASLNAEFNGDLKKLGLPGVLLRTESSRRPLKFCCRNCPNRTGADCKAASALYHKSWSVANADFLGHWKWKTAGAKKGHVMSTYMMEWAQHDYAIVFNKTAVTPAIRCAYASDGQTERRLGHGCGCPCGRCCNNSYQLPCAYRNEHGGQGSPEIVGCHCASTSHTLWRNDTSLTCYWKGPAFLNGDGTTGTNELPQFVQHRLFAGLEVGYHTTLYHWTELVLGATELNRLVDRDPSSVFLAFATSRHCDAACRERVFAIRDSVEKSVPVIGFDHTNSAQPFRAASSMLGSEDSLESTSF